jgi:multidrug efflux pump subunit AcrB
MIQLFARHRTAANLLMLGLVAIGVLSISQLQRETFPDYSSDEVEITVVHPGASAEDVEEGICQRLEDALDGVRNLAEIRADAREGVGTVTVEMQQGEDFITFKDDVKTAVDGISDFPDDAEDPVVRELGTTDVVMVLLVTGDMGAADLKAYCEELKDRMLGLPELSLVEIQGFSDHQLRVELEPLALQALGLSVAEVADRIARQNVDLPAGTIETDERDLLLRFQLERRTPAELEELVVIEDALGGEVLLGEIATVTDLFESAERKTTLGGRRAGVLSVEKTRSEDVIRLARVVKRFLATERERQPPGVEIAITQDMSTLTLDRMTMLVKNAW